MSDHGPSHGPPAAPKSSGNKGGGGMDKLAGWGVALGLVGLFAGLAMGIVG